MADKIKVTITGTYIAEHRHYKTTDLEEKVKMDQESYDSGYIMLEELAELIADNCTVKYEAVEK